MLEYQPSEALKHGAAPYFNQQKTSKKGKMQRMRFQLNWGGRGREIQVT